MILNRRKTLVALAWWCHEHRNDIHYAQDRPIVFVPYKHLPFTTDCSGIVTLLAKWVGAPDPNGVHYNGSGFLPVRCSATFRPSAASTIFGAVISRFSAPVPVTMS